MIDRFYLKWNDALCASSHETPSGWAETRLVCADMALAEACKSRRHWRNACFVLSGLLALTLGVLVCVVML